MAEVGCDKARPTAASLDSSDGLGAPEGVAAVDDDLDALISELKSNRTADAGGCARDQGFLAFKGWAPPHRFPCSAARAEATMSALVLAWPSIPQPPSGDSVMSTQVRPARFGSSAAAATISVSSLTTPSCLSRSSTLIGVSTWTRT